MRRLCYSASAALLLAVALILLSGCATQARTPWGNLDMKGGSGSECKPFVAPDAGRRQLPKIRPVQPVQPVAPVQPIAAPVPVPPSVEVSGGRWPPRSDAPVRDLACIE